MPKLGGKQSRNDRRLINQRKYEKAKELKETKENVDISDLDDTQSLKIPLRRQSPTKKSSWYDVSDPIRVLIDEAFLPHQEIDDKKLEDVWNHFADGENALDDESLERLLVEFLILARSSAQRQIKRQQQALKHIEKRDLQREDTGIPTNDNYEQLIKLKADVHERFPAVGDTTLSKEAGKAAVHCNQILARVSRGSSFLHPFKQILNPNSDEVRKIHFMKNFPSLITNLCSQTNVSRLTELAPIKHASSGTNLMWRPDADLGVGPVVILCEFEFTEIEGVVEEEKFSIPEETPLKRFVEHLFKLYPNMEEYKDDLEIQIQTDDEMHHVRWDSDFVLESCELIFMDDPEE